jgi:two-component system, sensor histidine kinase RpfC
MNLSAALRARLRARPDREHEQAILRVVLVGLITVYMWGRITAAAHPVVDDDRLLLGGLLAFFVLALAIFAAICVWPAVNPPRRILGMLVDAGCTTFALFLTGVAGVWLVGVYLFVIFGNGFRYGARYLLLCQMLCLAGFLPVVILAPWWREEPYVGYGLIMMMIVLPNYVSVLLKRMLEERAKTELALKECLERGPRVARREGP